MPGPATAVDHAAPIDPRRYLNLTVVVAAQFMFVVDAFIVNVAIPSIRADLLTLLLQNAWASARLSPA